MAQVVDTGKLVRVTGGMNPALYVDRPLAVLLDEQATYDQLLQLFHPDGMRCPCGSENRIGWGSTKTEFPLYRCRECGKTYFLLTDTVFSGCHLNGRKLFLLMRMLGDGRTVEEIGIEINMAAQSVQRLIDRVHLYSKHMVQ